jgi:hypothetical protein
MWRAVATATTALLAALLGTGLAACGHGRSYTREGSRTLADAVREDGAGRKVTPRSWRAGSYVLGDGDYDGDARNHYDDPGIRGYGHPLHGTGRRVVAALVKLYFAAAAAGDGARACSLLVTSVGRDVSLGEVAERVYPPAPSVPPLRGESCARIMSLVFHEAHQRLVASDATLRVTGVRTKDLHGLVLLGFQTSPERYIPVRREHGGWRIDALLDEEIP